MCARCAPRPLGVTRLTRCGHAAWQACHRSSLTYSVASAGPICLVPGHVGLRDFRVAADVVAAMASGQRGLEGIHVFLATIRLREVRTACHREPDDRSVSGEVRTLRLVQEAAGAEGVHRVEVLFRAVFHASDDTRDLWATVRDHLADTRVEVVTDVAGATAIPWELLRDPTTNVPLALRARAFVRSYQQAAQRPAVPAPGAERLRVLLVICRPDAGQDVPFRSVASHVVRLSPQARAAFQLDVLRPPTFARLGQVLRDASERGEPYHVVHFDGHGTWADLSGQPGEGGVPSWLRSQRFVGRAGAHGWMLFEQPDLPGNVEYVDGPALGGLLAESGVPVLVLNACCFAHAALATTPQQTSQAAGEDVHARVRASGSLAQEVMDAGVAGVVAMRYSVYVVTAAQFVGELYASLLAGRRLGEAVTRGRKHLADQPVREVGLRPVRVQDWMVPVVYEATALPVVTPKATDGQVELTLDPVAAAREREALESALPDAPDA